ncbi:hypothetical protein [Brevundimonas sp.]|nr:hypothetical protein [Brevundimonas sp.]
MSYVELQATSHLLPPKPTTRSDPGLKPMTPGREVVEDYSHIGLTLRDHPLSFLRGDLQARHVMTCVDGTALRDGRLTRVAGLVLVRQKPGKGGMFITIEDETGVANLVIWPSLDEREGDVVHIVATKLHDASGLLASVGDRGEAFPLPDGRGDEFHRGASPDARDAPSRAIMVRDIYIPDLHLDAIRLKTRNFR